MFKKPTKFQRFIGVLFGISPQAWALYVFMSRLSHELAILTSAPATPSMRQMQAAATAADERANAALARQPLDRSEVQTLVAAVRAGQEARRTLAAQHGPRLG